MIFVDNGLSTTANFVLSDTGSPENGGFVDTLYVSGIPSFYELRYFTFWVRFPKIAKMQCSSMLAVLIIGSILKSVVSHWYPPFVFLLTFMNRSV